MKQNIISDVIFKDFIYKELDSISDLQLLILKGHILIEYSLNKFIVEISDLADSEISNISFFNKMKISRALGLYRKSKPDDLENSISDMNKIRNQIAHTLTFDKEILEKIIGTYLDNDEFSSFINRENTIYMNLYHIIPSICGNIIGRKLAKQKISDFSKHILAQVRNNNPEKFDNEFKRYKIEEKIKTTAANKGS